MPPSLFLMLSYFQCYMSYKSISCWVPKTLHVPHEIVVSCSPTLRDESPLQYCGGTHLLTRRSECSGAHMSVRESSSVVLQRNCFHIERAELFNVLWSDFESLIYAPYMS
jgi:hypothetical protein